MAFLTVTNISKSGKDGYAVKNISFSQQLHEKIAIAGETGSGKTTLLKIIGGLLQPGEGLMRFEENKILGPEFKLIAGHPGIVYLSQHFELRNNYRVHEILGYANKMPEAEARNLYQLCRIDHLMNRRTNELSGGEKQRIALARLVSTKPKLLLLDEPFSNLDVVHRNMIKEVLNDLGEQLGLSCMMVSHDAADILSWADTVLVMKDGKLVQQGSPETIYNKPGSTYCAGLFGAYNLLQRETALAISGVKENQPGKQMLVRPEQITLAASGHPALKGTVENILFWGSYYTIDVIVHQQTIRVSTSNPGVKTGDSVFVSVNPNQFWWI